MVSEKQEAANDGRCEMVYKRSVVEAVITISDRDNYDPEPTTRIKKTTKIEKKGVCIVQLHK